MKCMGRYGYFRLVCTVWPGRGGGFALGRPEPDMVYIRYFWQGNHQIYSHILCVNTRDVSYSVFVYYAVPY